MNLKEQLYVCTLAETGNLTQAAKRLFLSQPALSLYISNLENHLGIRLFERVGKQFVLTEAGELYVGKARQMLDLKNAFDTELANMINGQNERLRVGIQDIRAHFLMPNIIPAITEEFPKTKFCWTTGNYSPMEQMLMENQLDIFFCNCKTKKREFEYIPLISDEVVFITAKNHPLASRAEIRNGHSFPWINLSLFSDERFILTGEGQSLRVFSDQILKANGVAPKNIMILKKIFILISLVNKGYGVGFSLVGYINWSRSMDNIRIFSVTEPAVTATFYAIYKKGRRLTPAASSLIELVKSSLTQQVSDIYQLPYTHPASLS